MKALLAVGLGGFCGAITRYGVAWLVARFSPWPLGTLLINLSGSLVLGFFAVWVATHRDLDPAWRLAVATGFLGSYTTFSTFEFETHALLESGESGWALLYVLASVVGGFAALRLGIYLAR